MNCHVELRKFDHGLGGYHNMVEDHWLWLGRSLMQAQPLFNHGYVVLRSEASKAVAGVEKSDSGECIKLARMTTGNTDYLKYDPPCMQNSCDALAKSIFRILLPFGQSVRRK